MPRWGAERRARPLPILPRQRGRRRGRRAPHRFDAAQFGAPIGAPPPYLLREELFLAWLAAKLGCEVASRERDCFIRPRDSGGGGPPEGWWRGRLTRRFVFVARLSSRPAPLPPRFRLRAPRFGGLKPAVARRASEGGSRGTSPVFTGEDDEGRLRWRFVVVAERSLSPTPLPPRFRLRAPRFGGLKPAVARRASEGGSRGTSPVFTGEDEDGRLRWRFVVVAERSLSPTLLPPPGACHRAGHFGPDPLARHLPRFHGGGLSVHARAYRPRLKKRSF